jgi:hypothetical protein
MSRPFALLAVLASILFGLSAANAQSFDPNNPAGSGYSRIFFDDFSGPLDTTKWSPTWPWGGGLNSTYPKDEALPDDITFSNGAAQFLVKKQRSPSGKRYSTSTASTYGKFFRTFGYFEASIKLPANARGL